MTSKAARDPGHHCHYSEEVDRLRMELGKALAQNGAIVSEMYQRLSDLSQQNMALAAVVFAVPQPQTQPQTAIQPRPFPQPRQTTKTPPARPVVPPTTSNLLTGAAGGDDIMTVDQACEYLDFARNTLKAYRSKGTGPKYIAIDGDKKNPYGYRKADIDEWALARGGKARRRVLEQSE